jgi:hypothetical protein
VFSPSALLTGFDAMSKRKRNLFLEAEFPHFREHILRFDAGPAIYSKEALSKLFGSNTEKVLDMLLKIGFLSKTSGELGDKYSVPFLYRPAFNIRQTSA